MHRYLITTALAAAASVALLTASAGWHDSTYDPGGQIVRATLATG